jgi:hypothetical protein
MSTINPTNRCPECLKWFVSTAQMQNHRAKSHAERAAR